ncbi:MAG TPA: VOC family protein [Polyangiaceae bacterium]
MPRSQRIQEKDGPRLVAAFPQALVSDVARAAEFYRNKLGFQVVYLHGEPPFYGLVERGGAGINLRHVDAPAHYRPEGDPDVLTANIPVHGIEALFLELRARGVDFAQTLKEEPWGASDFIVRDPDGNLLCFASVVELASARTGR